MQSLYDTAEAAFKLNMSTRWITRNARRLGGTKKGRVWRFPPENIARAQREDVTTKGSGRPRSLL